MEGGGVRPLVGSLPFIISLRLVLRSALRASVVSGFSCVGVSDGEGVTEGDTETD